MLLRLVVGWWVLGEWWIGLFDDVELMVNTGCFSLGIEVSIRV